MLSPTTNLANSLLTQAFAETLQLDSYSTQARSISIGKLPLDPAWLAPVRHRVTMLATAGAAWTEDRPGIWGAVLAQFADYSSMFAGVAREQALIRGNPAVQQRAQWINLLGDVLLPQLDSAASATAAANAALAVHCQKFKSVQPLLEESINDGWAALSAEEHEMTQIASELTHLQDVADSLAGSITSAEITSGQRITTTTVTTLYSIAVEAGVSFSFLSLAGSVLTVGKMYYDIVSSAEEITESLRRIAALQLKASEEAQAAAGTKMILRLLYSLELSFSAISDVLPRIEEMWRAEQQKVQALIEALRAGSKPANEFELLTVTTANANWQTINRFAQQLCSLKSEVGTPVTFNPQDRVTIST